MNAVVPDMSLGRRVIRSAISVAASLLAVGLAAVVAALGWDYYSLPRAERPFHAYHNLLHPSGRAGLIFAVYATALFVLNLTYLIRKRLINVRWLGSLRVWMSLHATTGIVGGAVIVLHTAFAPSSALGILALVALAITVASGIIGRYLYAKVPRSLEGRELEIEQVRERLHTYRHQLEDIGVSAEWLYPPTPLEGKDHPRSMPARFLALLSGDRQSRRDYRRLRRAILAAPELHASARHILPLAQAFCRYQHWLIRCHELRHLLASWRFFHRWLAIVMLVVVTFHVGLAVRFGHLWMMGGTP
jgi:hypothetical protein